MLKRIIMAIVLGAIVVTATENNTQEQQPVTESRASRLVLKVKKVVLAPVDGCVYRNGEWVQADCLTVIASN